MELETYMHDLGRRARAASRLLAKADAASKNKALALTADAIERDRVRLIEANAKDVAAARAAKLDAAAIDRLTLTDKTIAAMADGLRQIATLPEPVGEISELKERPTGIRVGRMRVPLGVIAIIYESRPNVTADAAGLCLKSARSRFFLTRRLQCACMRDCAAQDCPKTRCRSSTPPIGQRSACCCA